MSVKLFASNQIYRPLNLHNVWCVFFSVPRFMMVLFIEWLIPNEKMDFK